MNPRKLGTGAAAVGAVLMVLAVLVGLLGSGGMAQWPAWVLTAFFIGLAALLFGAVVALANRNLRR
ncbi:MULTISPECIES: hypothetical protein [Kocuria]|jgi:NADH:ubiquinone oxidoreductase subunit 2 (subunit N)|uniref:hypothetical protein n=1 Tax=Kocuria TaxID=57493 RepID=UPI00203C630E|nr:MULTISPECIES: hypothetical protein [Kocuria]MCM3689619.1 hypothetical protein [Kocuria rosea]HST71518.1 hypothetical protein [Kocuria rosea]